MIKASFPVVRGHQSGREFYTAMIPLRAIEDLLDDGSENQELDPVFRQQRKTNPARARKIAEYMHDNTDTPSHRRKVGRDEPSPRYVLPALTVSIDGESAFLPIPVDEERADKDDWRNVGVLQIHRGATLLVNDGLHRRSGIVEALRKLTDRERRKLGQAQAKAHDDRREELRDQSITVTIYPVNIPRQSQQMFVDINKNASKPNTALSMTFDHRDRINALARQVAQEAFPGRIEFERATAGDGKLFSINAVVGAVKTLCEAWYGGDEPDAAAVVDFFKRLAAAMKPEWQPPGKLVDILGGDDAEEVTQHISRQNIALEAIAIALAQANNWKTLTKRLADGRLDWRRDAPEWEACHVVVDGRIIKTKRSTQAMGMAISRAVRSR